MGTDEDFDGFYTGVSVDNPQYDSNDNDACYPDTTTGACECPEEVDNEGKMTICLYYSGFPITWQINARDWQVYKITWNANCGPCNGN